jgi:hypothetical protein
MSSTSTTWTTDTNTKSGTVQIYSSEVSVLRITAGEGADAILDLFADQGDDNADKWRMWVNNADDDLHFSNYTSGTAWTDILTLQDGGNVGIGVTAPTRTLQVLGDPGNDGELVCFDNSHSTVDDSDVILLLRFNGDDDASNGHYIEFADSGTTEMTGTIVASSGTATNNSVSDYRIKENISLIEGGLDRINALKPSYFNFKRYPDKVHEGFIAHEVEEAGIDYAVFGEKDAVKIDKRKDSPTYGEEVIDQQQLAITSLIPQMVSAIQELTAKVEALENNNE